MSIGNLHSAPFKKMTTRLLVGAQIEVWASDAGLRTVARRMQGIKNPLLHAQAHIRAHCLILALPRKFRWRRTGIGLSDPGIHVFPRRRLAVPFLLNARDSSKELCSSPSVADPDGHRRLRPAEDAKVRASRMRQQDAAVHYSGGAGSENALSCRPFIHFSRRQTRIHFNL